MGDEIDQVAEGAARLALLVAGVPPSPTKQGAQTFRLNATQLNYDKVIAHLVSLPKPIQVEARDVGGTLHIATAPVGRDQQMRFRAKSLLAFLEQTAPGGGFPRLVICRQDTKTIEVSIDEFREWERSYATPTSLSACADIGDSQYARAQGFEKQDRDRAAAVVVFSGAPSFAFHFRMRPGK